jgi:RNA polymerase sigma factor (sigma-70 family)
VTTHEWRLARRQAHEVLTTLVRRYGHFAACEDAVQEALLAAAKQWPAEGWPTSQKAWLLTVASRRLTDELRSEGARRRREEADAARTPPPGDEGPAGDDSLTLMFLCCHPSLSPASQVALTLRAVGGLTTAEIARAFLVPEATMAQRISRAKDRIRAAGATFRLPPDSEREARLQVVLNVLYLIFNEGYTAAAGPVLVRDDLTDEAIRLTRMLLRLVPDDGEVAGLLALMLLTDARRPARTGPDGSLVPLTEQDRSRWETEEVAEGVALVTGALEGSRPIGRYQVQAAIAAVHDEAPTAEDTDWPQILALYGVLERLDPSPVVRLNRAVAVAMVHGPAAGLELAERLADDPRIRRSHHLESVRGHLLEMDGDDAGARAAFLAAARRANSVPEQRHLLSRAARLATPPNDAGHPGGIEGKRRSRR